MRFHTSERGPTLARVAALMVVTVWPAQAYIDPGNGLLIWQILGAFFVGAAYQLRKLVVRLRNRK